MCHETGRHVGVKRTPHKLRKTHTTLAIRKNATADMLMRDLGWEKLETASYYIKISKTLKHTTADLMPTFE